MTLRGSSFLSAACRIFTWLLLTFSLPAGDHLMHGGTADPLMVPAWDDVFAEGPFDLPDGEPADAGHCLKQGQLALMELRDDAAERWFRAVLRNRPDDVAALWGLAAASVDRPGRSAAFARRAVAKCTPETPDRDRRLAELFRNSTEMLQGPPTGALSRSAALTPPRIWTPGTGDHLFSDIRDRHLHDPVAGMMDVRRHLHHYRPLTLNRRGLAESLDWLPLQMMNLKEATPPLPESGEILRRIMAASGVKPGVFPEETSPLLCHVTAGMLLEKGSPQAARRWLHRMAQLSSGILQRWPAEPRAMHWLHAALTEKAHLEASLGLTDAAKHSAAAAGPETQRAVLIRLELWDALQTAAESALPRTAGDSPERVAWLSARVLTDLSGSRRDAARTGLAELRETLSRWEQTPGAASAEQLATARAGLTELECRQAVADGMLPLAKDLLEKKPLGLELSRRLALAAACGERQAVPPEFRTTLPETGIPEYARILQATGALPPDLPRWLAPALSDPEASGALVEALRAHRGITPGKAPDIPADQLPAPLKARLWTAPDAPSFSLPDAAGTVHTREALKGAPALVVFFLGARCEHCLQQLDTLNAWKPRLDAAGVRIISISVNGQEGVKQTFAGPDRAAKIPYPFPVLADPEFTAFREWGAWDAFDRAPVHGTFLLDAKGRVLWRHAGTQPFMRIDILHTLAIQAGKG